MTGRQVSTRKYDAAVKSGIEQSVSLIHNTSYIYTNWQIWKAPAHQSPMIHRTFPTALVPILNTNAPLPNCASER